MFGNIGEMMKLQKQFKDIQKKIKKAEHRGSDSSGKVNALVNGEFTLLSIEIDDELIKSTDKKAIEKAVLSAVNSAVNSSKDFAAAQMKEITGGMNIPGLSDLLS